MGAGPVDVPAAVRSLWVRLDEQAPTYLVGGCLRDALLGGAPKDFDLATALTPEQVGAIAAAAGLRVIPTGVRFGTVTVLTPAPVEVTTFRAEAGYSDSRHPDTVHFTPRVDDDLARRDFTVNAMAMAPSGELVDPFGGRADLATHTLRAVGDPAARFREDPLRMWRAVRFLSQLGAQDAPGDRWQIAPETLAAIARHRVESCTLSGERVRDELLRLLGSTCLDGLQVAVATKLIYVAIPELAALEGFEQHHPGHDTDVLVHTLAVVAGLPPDPLLRLAGLLHDIAKPQCVLWVDGLTHFYGHDALGAIMAEGVLRRLRLPNEMVARVANLVGHHMFPWEQAGPKGYRRLAAQVGSEGLRQLLDLHVADVRGSRRAVARWELPEAVAARVDEVLAEASNPASRLAIDGHDIMEAFTLQPGPEVGHLLAAAREWVWEDTARNEKEAILEYLNGQR